jgi:hypothetical protein
VRDEWQAQTRCAWILAFEGHESGRTGQRGGRDVLCNVRIVNMTFDAWSRGALRKQGIRQ